MSDFRVQGADELNRLARKLRQAGDKTLRKELYAGLQRATKPIRADVTRTLAARLPQHGGLARKMAKARVTTKIRTANRNTRLTIQVSSPRGEDFDVQAIDRGAIRHPTYGHRPWVVQRIAPGAVSEPLQRGAPAARREAAAALERVAKSLEGK